MKNKENVAMKGEIKELQTNENGEENKFLSFPIVHVHFFTNMK